MEADSLFMIRDNRTQLRWRTRLLLLSLLFACAVSTFTSTSPTLAAPSNQPSGPDRFSVTTVDYTKYIWWMIRWGEEDVVCKIVIGHGGMPTPGDVFVDCGEEIYDKWVNQKLCTEPNVKNCKGFFVTLVDSKPAQKEISTMLPPATV